MQDSQGGVLTSVYDAAENLTTRKFGGSGQTPLRLDLTYNARDQIANETRYSDLAGTQQVGLSTFIYDTAGRVTNMQHGHSTTILANFTYTYDLASRLTQEQDNGTSTTYSYDVDNQLTTSGGTNYTYDLNGNRTMSGYTTGTNNQLTNDGTWTYTYDSDNNLTKKSKGASAQTWFFAYDHLGHMTSAKQEATDGGTLMSQATYTYDLFGQLLQEDAWTSGSGLTTTRFGYDQGNAWVDLNGSNQLQTRRLYLDTLDSEFARIASAGTAAWYLTDHLGSIRNTTDNSGNLIDTLVYDAYGNTTSESNSANGDRYKWDGGQLDSVTGLYLFGWRYYNSTSGRWTTQDPLGFSAGDDNLFRCVKNAPTLYTDPTGLFEEPNPPREVSKGEEKTRSEFEQETYRKNLPDTTTMADPRTKEEIEKLSKDEIDSMRLNLGCIGLTSIYCRSTEDYRNLWIRVWTQQNTSLRFKQDSMRPENYSLPDGVEAFRRLKDAEKQKERWLKSGLPEGQSVVIFMKQGLWSGNREPREGANGQVSTLSISNDKNHYNYVMMFPKPSGGYTYVWMNYGSFVGVEKQIVYVDNKEPQGLGYPQQIYIVLIKKSEERSEKK